MNLRLGLLVLALAARPLAGAEELRCASAESMDGLMAAWTAGFTATHPETPARVVLRARYSADFVGPLGRGEVSVAPFARELFASERAQLGAVAGHELKLVPVALGSRATKGGTHAIVMFVNARNPLARLALPQLREVWARAGKITTWGQLGLTGEWAHRPITLHGMRVRRTTGNPPGIVNFLEQRMLGGRDWNERLKEYVDVPGGPQSLEQIVRAVAADEGAIGYSGFAYATAGAKPIALAETEAGPAFSGSADEIARGEYPLSRRVYLALAPRADGAAAEFLQYVLSPEGQKLIGSDPVGFFPLPTPARVPPSPLPAGPSGAGVDPALPAFQPDQITFPAKSSYATSDGAIAIIGYNDMRGLLTALNARFVSAHPDFKFALTLNGTRTAPPALAQGRSAFAPMGAEFSADEMTRYRRATGGEPRMFRVAHASLSSQALSGPLAIIVHRDNPLTALTLSQVKQAFVGATRWGELGLDGSWGALTLDPCGLRPELALGIFFRARVGTGETFAPGFQGFAQSSDVVKAVANNPRAIGFTAVNRVTPGVKVLAIAADDHSRPVELTEENVRAGRYPLDRYLLIYAREPVDPVVEEYLRLVLSRDGQAAIAADGLGYLPLNAAEAAIERQKLAPFKPSDHSERKFR